MIKDILKSKRELRARNAFNYKRSLRKNLQGGVTRLFGSNSVDEVHVELNLESQTECPEFNSCKLSVGNSHRVVDIGSSLYFITNPRLTNNPIIYASQSFLDLTGYTSKQIFGKPYPFIHGQETDKGTLSLMKKSVIRGTDSSFKILVYRSNGSSFDCMFDSYFIRDLNNTITNITCIVVPLKIENISNINSQESSVSKVSDNIGLNISAEECVCCVVVAEPDSQIKTNNATQNVNSSDNIPISGDHCLPPSNVTNRHETVELIPLQNINQKKIPNKKSYALDLSDLDFLISHQNFAYGSNRQVTIHPNIGEEDVTVVNFDDSGDFVYIPPRNNNIRNMYNTNVMSEETVKLCVSNFLVSSSLHKSSILKHQQNPTSVVFEKALLPKDTENYYLRIGISSPDKRPVLRRSESRSINLFAFFNNHSSEIDNCYNSKKQSKKKPFVPISLVNVWNNLYYDVIYNMSSHSVANVENFWSW